VRQRPGAVNPPNPITFASWSARRVLCLSHVQYMCAHRIRLLAASRAHAKRARSRCTAAATGQAPTPCTRTRQIQRGHSFPCETHAPWLHMPPEECMGSMKRDLAFWTCHTSTPRSSGRVTAAVGGLQDAPSCSAYGAQCMQRQQGGNRWAEVDTPNKARFT
jgi:hypothetical protein